MSENDNNARFFSINIDDAPTGKLKLDRGWTQRLINEDTGAKKVDVHINHINDDSGPGELHYHAHTENVYIVLEGVLEVVVEGTQYLLHPGTVGFIPPGVHHTAGSLGGHGVTKVIEIYAPAGKDFHVVKAPE
ncbi:cupin domain-containing protein [Lentisalinibacter orientalis]|uniref:cupin domain-containing protein n=1 Tax=Lentisalinibacter orientalis TaxID=2992241 RepID=UPI0038694F34